MKKRIGIFVALVLLVSCGSKEGSRSSPLDFLSSVSSTNLQSETGGPITLGMSEADIKGKRGEPKLQGTMQNGETAMKYEDYQYVLVKNRLALYTYELGTMSGRQVKIGDGEEQVLKAYGDHYYKRTADNMYFMGYLDQENKKVMEFEMKGSKVQMILVADFSFYS